MRALWNDIEDANLIKSREWSSVETGTGFKALKHLARLTARARCRWSVKTGIGFKILKVCEQVFGALWPFVLTMFDWIWRHVTSVHVYFGLKARSRKTLLFHKFLLESQEPLKLAWFRRKTKMFLGTAFIFWGDNIPCKSWSLNLLVTVIQYFTNKDNMTWQTSLSMSAY